MVYLNWIFALLGAIMVGLLKDEVAAWLPKLAQWCVCRAADQMPDRERWREEWLAHLNECPGRLGQLAHALGVLTTAWRYKAGNKLSFYLEMFRYMQSPRWAFIDATLSVFSITFMILFIYSYFSTGEFHKLHFFAAVAFFITTFWSDHKFKAAYKTDRLLIEYFIEIRFRNNNGPI